MLFVVCTALATMFSALALLAHLRRVRRRQTDTPSTSSAKRSLLAAAVLATTGNAAVLPPVTALLVTSGIWLNWLVLMLVGCATGICVHMFYLFSVEQRSRAIRVARREWAIYGVVALATIALFMINPTARDFDFGPSGRYQAGGPGTWSACIAYMLPMGFSGVINIVVCRLGWRWSRSAEGTRWLAMALNANALGQIGGVFLVLHTIGYNAALLFGVVPSWTQMVVASPIKALANLLTMLGLSATALSLWFKNSRLVVWAHANQARRRLYPLWREMCGLFPAIVVEPELEPPPASAFEDMLRIRGAKRQLLDRIVECWEGRHHVRVPSGTRALARELGSAAGLRGPALDAVVEAAWLEVGFQIARQGIEIDIPELATADEASRLVRAKGTAAELRWWEEVQAARSSRIVTQVLDRTSKLNRNQITSDTAAAT